MDYLNPHSRETPTAVGEIQSQIYNQASGLPIESGVDISCTIL